MNSCTKWHREAAKWLFLAAWGRESEKQKVLVLRHGRVCIKDNFWLQGFDLTPLGEVTWTKPGQTCWKGTKEKSNIFYLHKRKWFSAQWMLPTTVCGCMCIFYACVLLFTVWKGVWQSMKETPESWSYAGHGGWEINSELEENALSILCQSQIIVQSMSHSSVQRRKFLLHHLHTEHLHVKF